MGNKFLVTFLFDMSGLDDNAEWAAKSPQEQEVQLINECYRVQWALPRTVGERRFLNIERIQED